MPTNINRTPDEQWERVVSDLEAYREEQRRAWGGIDEGMIARYVAGESSADEAARVKQGMAEFANVRECVELVRESLNEFVAPEPIWGRFRAHVRYASRSLAEGFAKLLGWLLGERVPRGAPYWALAACVLIALFLGTRAADRRAADRIVAQLQVNLQATNSSATEQTARSGEISSRLTKLTAHVSALAEEVDQLSASERTLAGNSKSSKSLYRELQQVRKVLEAVSENDGDEGTPILALRNTMKSKSGREQQSEPAHAQPSPDRMEWYVGRPETRSYRPVITSAGEELKDPDGAGVYAVRIQREVRIPYSVCRFVMEQRIEEKRFKDDTGNEAVRCVPYTVHRPVCETAERSAILPVHPLDRCPLPKAAELFEALEGRNFDLSGESELVRWATLDALRQTDLTASPEIVDALIVGDGDAVRAAQYIRNGLALIVPPNGPPPELAAAIDAMASERPLVRWAGLFVVHWHMSDNLPDRFDSHRPVVPRRPIFDGDEQPTLAPDEIPGSNHVADDDEPDIHGGTASDHEAAPENAEPIPGRAPRIPQESNDLKGKQVELDAKAKRVLALVKEELLKSKQVELEARERELRRQEKEFRQRQQTMALKDALRRLALILTSRDEDPLVRKTAVYVVGAFGNEAEPCLAALVESLSDEDVLIRRWAAFAIGEIGPNAEAAIPKLIDLLGQDEPLACPAAAYAVGKILEGRGIEKAADAVAALTKLLTSSDPSVRWWSADALLKLVKTPNTLVPARSFQDGMEAGSTDENRPGPILDPEIDNSVPATGRALNEPTKPIPDLDFNKDVRSESRATKLIVAVTGPATQEVGKQAAFSIVVTNAGQTPATNLTVGDHYDRAFRPLRSTRGSAWNEETAELTWVVDRLAAGKSLTIQVLCNCQEPSANSCNHVTVTSREGGRAEGEACVAILKPDGLAVLVSEDPDPVAVGNQTAYLVRVTNFGGSADQDLAVAVTLADGLTPFQVGTKGPAKYQVDGQSVRFEPVTEIAPNDTWSFTVMASAERAGKAGCQVQVSSRKLSKPIVVEETTTIE